MAASGLPTLGLAAALATSLPAGVAAVGQQPATAVVADIVRLDVVVSDASGKPVAGLTVGDFQVFEDGAPQTITDFVEVRRGQADSSGSEPATTRPGAPSPAPASEAFRHVVIVVDDLHMALETVEPAKAALLRFVDEQVAPDDRLAVVLTSSPASQQLTSERAALRQAIRRIRSHDAGRAAGLGSRMTPAQAELILRGDQSALRLAARLLMDEPASTLSAGSPRATVEARDGATPASLDAGEKAAAREAEREARATLAVGLRPTQLSLTTLHAVLRGLAALPGRKLCLLVSDGFLVGKNTSLEQTRLLNMVVNAATRAGAAVYALDTRGLAPGSADASVVGPIPDPGLRERVARLAREESRATLLRLAEDTGGLLLTDEGAALARMLADDLSYYLVGYTPSKPERDGRYRKLEVRLPRRPELKARTRRGYLADGEPDASASPALQLVAGSPSPREAAIRAALSSPLPADGVPVLATASYLALPPDGPQAIVQARVEATALVWEKGDDGRHRTRLDLLGGFYDEGGDAVGLPFGTSFELDLAEAEYRGALEQGLRYAQRVPLDPGRYTLRIVAHETTRGALGGATQLVEIPDLGEAGLTLSSLFVSAADAPGARLDADATSLHDAQLLRRFKSSDSLYFQVYVYNARADEGGATDVVLQAQIRSQGQPIAASKPVPAAFARKDGLPLPEGNGISLDQLSPGGYELRIVAVDRKAGVTAQRSLDFTVE